MKQDYLCPDCGMRIATHNDYAKCVGIFCWCKQCKSEKEIKLNQIIEPIKTPYYWENCLHCKEVQQCDEIVSSGVMKLYCVGGNVELEIRNLFDISTSEMEIKEYINRKMKEACEEHCEYKINK